MQAKLTAVARNAAGADIAGAGPFSFTSRNPSIVTVDESGLLSTIHTGSTYVVATLLSGNRTLVDSLGVDVGLLLQVPTR